MSKGVLVFARNNGKIDYIKQAAFLAKRVTEFLNLPTSVVTDDMEQVPVDHPFDKVIIADSIMQNTLRTFFDGSGSQKAEFKNDTRTCAYDLSPYEETLILDTDVVICNDIFTQCFQQPYDFLIYNDSYDITDTNRLDEFKRISETSIDFYWATCVFFRKTSVTKIFFDLLQHIQSNWLHYNKVYRTNSHYYRNDFSFSIAIHIMNGFTKGDFAKEMPGVLYYATDKNVLLEIDNTNLLILTDKNIPLRIKRANVHTMNKFSLNRCIDELS